MAAWEGQNPIGHFENIEMQENVQMETSVHHAGSMEGPKEVVTARRQVQVHKDSDFDG